MNTTVTDTRAEDDRTEVPGVCWDCGGPCVVYAGTVHGWRCRTCLARYMQRGQAAFDANQNDSSNDGEDRRDGGGLVTDRAITTPGTGTTAS